MTLVPTSEAAGAGGDRMAFDQGYGRSLQPRGDRFEAEGAESLHDTFGVAGNSLSPLFLLPLAGGVTTAGRYNIKMVADFVQKKGFKIKYGDTDSLYLSPPHACFALADRDYAYGRTTRLEYWTRMVETTMEELEGLRDKVNQHLREDNGTGRLRMAYEEVLFPVVFTGKKKYFGIPHEGMVNFRQKLFIRGIDVVKLGQTELAKQIGHRVMNAVVRVDNRRALITVVEDVLREAIENPRQWSFDGSSSDAWKPHKDNKSVQRFIARMRVCLARQTAEEAALYYIPDPGNVSTS